MRRSRASIGSRRWCRSGRRSTSPTVRSGWKESGARMCKQRVKTGVALCLCAAALLAQPSSTIRVNVNLVHAVATVKTQAGQLVGTLQKDDFDIYDNGVRQQI